MKTWILIAMLLTVPHIRYTRKTEYGSQEWDIDCILRFILFIVCCIWG